jgi:hypothetical protein
MVALVIARGDATWSLETPHALVEVNFFVHFSPPKILLFYFFHTVFLMDTQITVRHRHRPGESRIFQLRRVEVKIP